MEKQTVYLPVIKHNVFCKYRILNENGVTEHFANKEELFVFTAEQLNEYTAKVIKQSLKTAAKKAKNYNAGGCIINQSSITNTFEETFNKLKV